LETIAPPLFSHRRGWGQVAHEGIARFRGGDLHALGEPDLHHLRYGDFKTQLGPLGRALQELERRHMLLYPIGHVAASLIHMNANRLGLFQDEEHRLTYFLYALYDGFRHYIPATLPLTWEEI
jgi:hypothetical protein